MKPIRAVFALLFCLCALPLFSQNISHIVEKGDTLYSLSKKYGVSVDDLRSANAISGSDLYAGQKLIIPVKKNDKRVTYESYTVKAGDTLYSIAKRSEITVDELRRLNSLDSSAVLKIGQNLKVPAQSGATAQSGSAAQNAGSSSSGLALSVPDTSSSAPDNLSLIGSDKDPRAYSKKNGDTSLVWPVKASEVVYVAGKISGVALTGAKNEHVTAIRSGTVMFSGIYRGFGQVVFVQSANGLIYVYTGLDTLAVTKGQKVNYGQQLGIIGSDPISGKSLINLMVFKNGSPMDPAKAPRG
ncbi:LysM peptidoglycan-binding domain-containing protein [Treponema maltophilum]|uniref:LysM peptidoglycan-binding domain-containing protein n=1 Tax=Treponema maltophilum TaxID=51160 RepID=UPI003D947E66